MGAQASRAACLVLVVLSISTGAVSGQVICGVPAAEAVLITWEGSLVFGDRWRVFTPAGAYVDVYSTESRALAEENDATFVCEVQVFDNFQEFTGKLYRLNRPLHAGEQDARQLIAGGVLAPTARQGASICAECNVLREKFRIVSDKRRTFGAGLRSLASVRAELEGNTRIAAGIGAAYLILQSVNVSLGLATLACPVPGTWLQVLRLRGVMGGASGTAAYVEGGNAVDVTMAAIVAAAGGGALNEIRSVAEFMRSFEGRGEVAGLRRNLDTVEASFEATLEGLAREQRVIESDLRRAGCTDE